MSNSEAPTTGGGGGGSLEQFVLLAKSARGAAAKGLVEQAVASPGVYVFGELLACPSIAELASSPGTKAHHDLLTLFAFGTYEDFVAQRGHLPQLSDAMILKLRQLTIVSLATKNRRIPYSTLLNVLRLNNVRELEDIVIDAVYKGIIQGKLDPRNQRLEIEFWRGRDVSQQETAAMLATLGDWASRCQALVCNMEEQIERANRGKEEATKEQQRIETEIANLKKTLKMTGRSATPDLEEPSEVSSSRAPDERKKEAKRLKSTGLRGSSGARRFFSNQH